MTKRYSIGFRRGGSFGLEEYDGGYSIGDARREAAFFAAHLPEHVDVGIYVVTPCHGLRLVETHQRALRA